MAAWLVGPSYVSLSEMSVKYRTEFNLSALFVAHLYKVQPHKAASMADISATVSSHSSAAKQRKF